MQSHFSKAFDNVVNGLRSQGVEPAIERHPVASIDEVSDFEQATGVRLPESFAAFYTTFANGYSFEWSDGEEDGRFCLPSLNALADFRSEWIDRVREFADDPTSMDQCIDTEFRPQAFRIWSAMKNWIPLFTESEGDAFCLDTVTGAIVFDKHDWFDGFGSIAETNGLIAGDSLLDFILHWGRHSFRQMWFTDAEHAAHMTHLTWD